MKKLLCLLLLLSFSSVTQAKLIFSAPPLESAKDAKRYYGPIVDGLSKAIGQKVEYFHPRNFIEYARGMRAGKFDIVFDGPHFASWRMVHIDHEPIVTLDGKLQFYIITNKDHKFINSLKDVLGKALCGVASPNLGTLAAFNMYSDPIIQPTIKNIKGGGIGVLKAFLAGNCDAAVVRDGMYKKLPADKKAKVKVLGKSRSMPSLSITVSKHVDAATRSKMQAFFLSAEGAKDCDLLLERFSRKKKYFIKANPKEYAGLNELLEGVVFGW